MGWAVGFDPKWKRDIGYGVPALCDHPGCGKRISRGLYHVCGGEPYGGEQGCGLFFCGAHLWMTGEKFRQQCERCGNPDKDGQVTPFDPTPEVREWIQHKLRDFSWRPWRLEHPAEVERLRGLLATAPSIEGREE